MNPSLHRLKIKRVYDEPDNGDGFRILVDRIWPRGVRKHDASVDLWLKEIGPSTELRKWFGHDPGRWREFCRRYTGELEAKDDLVQRVQKELANQTVTLVYAAADESYNNARCLLEYLIRRLNAGASK